MAGLARRRDGGTLRRMSIAARHWGSVGLPAESFPRRTILVRVGWACVLLLAGGLAWSPVRAGEMYRCIGTHGEIAFSSTRAGYRDCRLLGSYGNPASAGGASSKASLARVRGSVVAANAPLAAATMPSLAWVQGTVATTAKALPSLASGRGDDADGAGLAAGAKGWPASTASGMRMLSGSVYRVVRADGSVEYTNVRPLGVSRRAVSMLFTYHMLTCFACNLHSTIDWDTVPLHLYAYADTIRLASARYGVDEAFLRAVIHAESAFNPDAVSAKGAQGLMQLMPGTASEMGVADVFNPDDNILGGARYLGLLLKTFNGDERLAAAAYNAGPAAVERYHGVPPYAETEVYVQRVGVLRKRYGAKLRAMLADRGQG